MLMFTTDQRALVSEESGLPAIDQVVADGADRLVASAVPPGSQVVACVAARRAGEPFQWNASVKTVTSKPTLGNCNDRS
jgi:hypothetical protein